MTPSTFELDYELTPEDVVAWETYWYVNLVLRPGVLNPLAGVIGAIIALGVVGVFQLVVWAAGLQWDPLLYWIYFYAALGGIVMAIVIARRERGTLRRKLLAGGSNSRLRKRDEQLVGRRSLTASADGFKVDSPVGSTSRKWNIVTGVHATDSHVFVVADVAVIVPRNAFPTDTECDEFVKAVERWTQQPRGEDRTLD